MRLYRIREIFVSQVKIITRHRFGNFGAVVLLFFGLVGLFAPYLAPHDPWESLRGADGKLAMLRPPCLEFPLGTTMMGRDILSQMIQATRTTVIIGLVSGLISILIGANIGLLSAYYGGRLDEIMMRFTDIIYGMPFLPFLIVLISLFGRNLWYVIIAICCIIWRTSARVVRAQALSIRQRQFILAAKARGCSDIRIIYGHIMPNILPLMLLYTAFNIAWSVLAEAGASFLGFSDPNHLTWGGMLYNLWISGKIRVAWWWFAWPSICIILLVSALVFISRAYEEVANPRLKQR
ncbi:MAG: ABC transporter permease [Deltaproteobacteria bacterium]|nr:ABC transporter permease [Deltaproteobacteria bacterium]MBW1994375.1 ABC transporter permease [Deltaproteobacteria bacterium]MBW2154985.1 ABC transporter permease [Deltaproteobacteria bacterium]